jgi:hypothetical protein
MSADRIVLFVGSLFQSLHAKRQHTLAVLVSALVAVGKIGVATLGRAIPGRVAPKHKIKLVDRFLGNTGVDVDECCEALALAAIGPRRSVRIAIDWTAVGEWPVLVASLVVRKRGIPIYWATHSRLTTPRSQNAFEEAFLSRLRSILPKDLDVTLLFDRGFRRISLARALKQMGFHFVVRCCGKTYVRGETYSGMIQDLGLPRGKIRDLGIVRATKSHKPQDVRFVALFDHDQKDAWYLFSDLDAPAAEVVRLYSRRFTIEEVFRDSKSTRYGWSLREYKLMKRPDRLDRLILVLATAYLLVTLIGLAIEDKGFERKFKANTVKTKTHSLFQLGWKGWSLVRWLPASWWRVFLSLDFDPVHDSDTQACSLGRNHP